MVFGDDDVGPFYLSPEDQIRKKYDRFSGITKTMEKNKKQLIDVVVALVYYSSMVYERPHILYRMSGFECSIVG